MANSKILIRMLMNIIHPDLRNNWLFVQQQFKDYFKINITEQEWRVLQNDNINNK
jgi:hypothetical protein